MAQMRLMLSMMNLVRNVLLLACMVSPSLGIAAPDFLNILSQSGQPAANVLASHDLWGNPTFIGSITNKGPDSQSVW